MDKVGPRNMVHCWATDDDDATVQPRWGKIGKQKIEDAGPLYPEADGDRRRRDPRPTPSSSSTRPRSDNKPFFVLAQPDAHARRDASLRQIRGDAHPGERLDRSRKPAWRSSTTSSARS